MLNLNKQTQQQNYNEILADASHTIKNLLSNLTCSYQYISHNKPQMSEIELWPVLGKSIDTLVDFMDKTTVYRKVTCKNTDNSMLNTILTELPDIVDDNIEADCNYNYDIPCDDISVNCSETNLRLILSALAINAAESSEDGGEIYISAHYDDKNAYVTIINSGIIFSIDSVSRLFYSEKSDHFGMGYSLAEKLVLGCGGEISINNNDGLVETTLSLPLFK